MSSYCLFPGHFRVLKPDSGRAERVFELRRAPSSKPNRCTPMLVLPAPMIVALILGFLFVRSLLAESRPGLFSALLALCALQSVLISLAQYYGIHQLRFVQPVTGSCIPPLAWIVFLTTAVRPFDPQRDLLHLAVPAFVAFCTLFVPEALDVVVPLVFAVYGIGVLWVLRAGADSLPLARLEAGNLPRLIWGGTALAFLISALSDALIGVAMLTGYGWIQPTLISVFSSLVLLWVGLVSLSLTLVGGRDVETAEDPQPSPAATDPAEDAALMDRLQALLEGQQLYLDPDLTLARLAKRLGVPAKQLSAAINRSTGDNVSRYINGNRIRTACARISAGDSITVAMLESGFNTKSNFNREFLRVAGMTPSAWQAANRA